MKKLNLGCGGDIKEDYLNVDFEKFKGVDVVHDLNKIPYPFKDGECEEILMYNILEHLDNPFEVMKEICRISKPGGRIHIYVPHFSCNDVWSDIQHKRGYSLWTFTNENMSMFKVDNQRIKFSRYGFLIELIANKFPRIYEKFFAYFFPASYLDIVLLKK